MEDIKQEVRRHIVEYRQAAWDAKTAGEPDSHRSQIGYALY
ncbi:hypothetical protein [Azotobacter armeniacus]